MTALHRLRFMRDDPVRVGVEHGGRAGVERRIDSEDQHDVSVEGFGWRLNESEGYFARLDGSDNSANAALPVLTDARIARAPFPEYEHHHATSGMLSN
jgi:hypothetical protein